MGQHCLGWEVVQASDGGDVDRYKYRPYPVKELKPSRSTHSSFACLHCRKCIKEVHPEYMTRIVPESLRQRTGACFFQDLWLFERPWSFNLEDLPPHVQKSVHIWHGTGDKQVMCMH